MFNNDEVKQAQHTASQALRRADEISDVLHESTFRQRAEAENLEASITRINRRVADMETVLQLLLDFYSLEVSETPEVKYVPARPKIVKKGK